MKKQIQNNGIFFVKDENGIAVACDALFCYESVISGKSVLVYTDDSSDEDGNTKVYACYLMDESLCMFPTLLPIENDEKEWMVIERVLHTIKSLNEAARESGVPEKEISSLLEYLINNQLV